MKRGGKKAGGWKTFGRPCKCPECGAVLMHVSYVLRSELIKKEGKK